METKAAAYERVRRWLEENDPLILAAADEIDQTLIDAALELSPWDRLRACSETNRVLSGFRRAAETGSG